MSNYILIDDNADQALAKRLLATNFAGTVLDGKVFSTPAYDLPEADEKAGNGSSTIQRYDLDGCVVFIESGEDDGLSIHPAGATITDFLDGWCAVDQTEAEVLASFGFDPDLSDYLATEGDTDVMIWCEPNYYIGTVGAPLAGYVRDDRGDRRIFATYDEAQAWIDEAESGIYCTAHGEAGRPAYTIVR